MSASKRPGRGHPGKRAKIGARDIAHRVLTGWAAGRVQRVGESLDAEWTTADLRRIPFEKRSAERGLAQDLVLGCVRHQGLLDRVLCHWLEKGMPKEPEAAAALRMGAYQLLFAERVPSHAAVDTSVNLAGRQRGLANAILRRLSEAVQDGPEDAALSERYGYDLPGRRRVLLPEPPQERFRFPPLDSPAGYATRFTLPEWLVMRWQEQQPDDAYKALATGAAGQPGVTLRPVGSSAQELAEALRAEGVDTEPLADSGLLRWTGGNPPFGTRAWVEGRLAVQDLTPFRAVSALEVAPGDHVLDLCAAPGTKTMVIAEAVGANGLVYAHDIDPKRLKRMPEEVARLGLEGRVEEVEDLAEDAPYDRVLVDAPCSNTGVLARRVEVRHRITAHEVVRLAQLQGQLLRQALQLVRPGGRVVYTTCSIEREENQQVVEGVVAAGRATLVREELQLPEPPLQDGGYFAVLQRPD